MPEQVVIIGSGPAGHTAAIYTSRANLKPVMFEGFSAGGIPGGQLMTTTEVENYPGFPKGVDGQQLMAMFREQSLRFGTRLFTEDVVKVDLSTRPFTVASSEREVSAHAHRGQHARDRGRLALLLAVCRFPLARRLVLLLAGAGRIRRGLPGARPRLASGRLRLRPLPARAAGEEEKDRRSCGRPETHARVLAPSARPRARRHAMTGRSRPHRASGSPDALRGHAS